MKRWLAWLLVFCACSTDFDPKQCAVDSECSDGSVCELRTGVPVCVPAEEAPLLIGQLSFGLGATSGFSPNNHQYSQSVWRTAIQPDGASSIQFFE